MSMENKVWTHNNIPSSLGAVFHKYQHFHGFWESSQNCKRFIFKTVTQPRSRIHTHIRMHFLLTSEVLHCGEHWIILYSLSQFAFTIQTLVYRQLSFLLSYIWCVEKVTSNVFIEGSNGIVSYLHLPGKKYLTPERTVTGYVAIQRSASVSTAWSFIIMLS